MCGASSGFRGVWEGEAWGMVSINVLCGDEAVLLGGRREHWSIVIFPGGLGVNLGRGMHPVGLLRN